MMTPKERVFDLAEQIEAIGIDIAKLEARRRELIWQRAKAFKDWRMEYADPTEAHDDDRI